VVAPDFELAVNRISTKSLDKAIGNAGTLTMNTDLVTAIE
jgi:transposase-like protein